MPRNFKLTWQAGSNGRKGRWRKKYKGRSHYFPGGGGKSDRDAYLAALEAWEKLKVRLDAEAPKPHQANYDRAIAEWELVLVWSRKHGEETMADTAMAKLERLRKLLAAVKPKPVAVEDTLDGQFNISVQFPGVAEAMKELDTAVKESASFGEDLFGNLPGYQEYTDGIRKFMEANQKPSRGAKAETYLDPAQLGMNDSDFLAVEHTIWKDRLDVMQRSAVSAEKTVEGHVETFLTDKKAAAAAGLITPGRVKKLRIQLTHFQKWLGQETPVAEITSSTLTGYKAEILRQVEAKSWSRTTAHERMSTAKSFVRWLWQIEAIAALPRVLGGKSNVLEIGKSRSPIVVFEQEEIQSLLNNASQRTKLYVLLMLNCGMTQKDIADIRFSEVDWKAARITRKRSKTRRHDSVPEVSYLLWPETLKLLRRERNPSEKGRVLLGKSGRPLWHEELVEEGKYKKSDSISSAFERLRSKLKIKKPLISLKKTSASLIRGRQDSSGLEDLFLGHAPQKLSEKHYAKIPQERLDETLKWLREEYRIEDCGIV
ncbi:MAG: hypothetical protein U9N87_09970 [Planctomycetota bacterium]|nr:hypothetical protein [Planctomycetota bacterium]